MDLIDLLLIVNNKNIDLSITQNRKFSVYHTFYRINLYIKCKILIGKPLVNIPTVEPKEG